MWYIHRRKKLLTHKKLTPMKSLKLSFLLLACALLPCITASAQISKGAVISVFGDRNLSDDPMETKIYEKLMKDTAFNLVPIVNKFDKTIREKFLPQFPFPFVTKDEVVKAQGYPELKDLTRWAKDPWYTSPADNYVSIAAFG